MIYLHVPFCRSFCRYCGFYSEIAGKGCDFSSYLDSVCREIALRREDIQQTLAVNTLYIGGGTPSVLPPSAFARVLREIGIPEFEEFTVEINPEDIVEKGRDYVRALMDLGVNRFSMGVQSLSDPVLKWMGRRHDADGARRAYDILRDAGAENVSVDIIFGISGVRIEDSLREMTGWCPDHVSAYQLSVEEGSALDGSDYVEADEEFCREQYLGICDSLRAAGYEHYEISNWALSGRRAVHNSSYWRRVPYVGLGPGAHSLLPGPDSVARRRCWNSQDPITWTSCGEDLSDDEIREEELMLGLRTIEGYKGRVLSEAEWFVSDSIIADLLAE